MVSFATLFPMTNHADDYVKINFYVKLFVTHQVTKIILHRILLNK